MRVIWTLTTKLAKQKRNVKLKAYRRTFNGRISRAAESANKFAKDHNLKGRVSAVELRALYEQQGGLCILTGRSLTCDRPNADSHMSLDHLVAIACPSGTARGSVDNMLLVRLPINKIKRNEPLCRMFGEHKPVLTQYMQECLSKERQREIVELQYLQLKALGKDVVEGEYVSVKNYRRRNISRCKNKTN